MAMSLPVLAAMLAFWIPFDPAGDNAEMAGLIAEGLRGAKLAQPGGNRTAKIAGWTGADCRSSFELRFGGKVTRPVIDWAADDVFLAFEHDRGVVFTGGFAGAGAAYGLELQFETAMQARRAATAVRNLRNACAPQR